MNGHKALIRAHFQDQLLQRDHWLVQEKQDLDKLETVLQYLMQLNHEKKKQLDEYEHHIKSKSDERNNLIVEQYQQHINQAKEEVDKQWDVKGKAIEQLRQQVIQEQKMNKYQYEQWQQKISNQQNKKMA